MIRLTAIAMSLTAFCLTPALAAGVTSLGQFKQWNAWSYKDGARLHCFASSAPVTSRPDRLNHGEVTFFLKTMSTPGARTEASFQTGYDFREGTEITLTIGSETFRMTAVGNSAWLVRQEREPELLSAMRGGSTMALSATSARGNDTAYVFSLEGVTAATTKILAQCR